jgi:WD40 repeat protein
METFKAHSLNVKSLDIDPQEDFIISGSNEGNVKAWELPTLQPLKLWENVHEKHTFVRKPGVFAAPVSTYGVMQVMFNSKHVFTCGSDGQLLRIAYERQLSN